MNAPVERRDLSMQTRAAPVTTYDNEKRTVSVVWSTGAQVKRFDWWNEREYIEELSMDPRHVRLDRLRGGAPVLDSHSSYGLNSVIGVVQSADLVSGQGTAELRFSARDDVAGVVQDVRDGILRNVSVGYRVHKMERIPPKKEGEVWVYRAVDWEPFEISIVAVPADPKAGTRSADTGKEQQTNPCDFFDRSAAAEHLPSGETMSTNENATPAAAPAAASSVDAESIRKLELERSAGIFEAVEKAGLDVSYARKLITDGVDLDKARAQIINELAERSNKTRLSGTARVETLVDETETRRGAIADAIVHRLAPSSTLPEAARAYRHMSLLRMAEESLRGNGIKVDGMSAREIAERALHSTSDFPAILQNVISKRLRDGYTENEPSYLRWARRAPNAPDFKQMSVTQLSATPDLIEQREGDEVKYGKMSDGKENYALVTFSRGLNVSRQTLINDDLRAFDRVIAGFSSSARRLENRLVYRQLTSNPVMGDGKNLFSAEHGNLATGSALNLEGLKVSRAMMRKQKGLQAEELNIAPSYLLVPTDLEQAAYQFTSTQFVPAKSADINEFRSGGRTALEPIVDAVLDAASASGWYLLASNGDVDTVEFCYLDGAEGVYVESMMDFDTDGMKVKARLDFAAKAIDWRGMVFNPGTGA